MPAALPLGRRAVLVVLAERRRRQDRAQGAQRGGGVLAGHFQDQLRPRLENARLAEKALELQDVGKRHNDRAEWFQQILDRFRELDAQRVQQELQTRLRGTADGVDAMRPYIRPAVAACFKIHLPQPGLPSARRLPLPSGYNQPGEVHCYAM